MNWRNVHLFLTFCLLVISCTADSQSELKSENEKKYDSLQLIILSDSGSVNNGILSNLEFGQDILHLSYKEIVKKHNLDSAGQNDMIFALQITADIIRIDQKLRESLNLTDYQLDSLMNSMDTKRPEPFQLIEIDTSSQNWTEINSIKLSND